MAQQNQQYHPRAYSPPRSTPSPHPGSFLPPTKRQRLSPNPQTQSPYGAHSPYGSPNLSNIVLPPNFQHPYNHTHLNGSYNGGPPAGSYSTMDSSLNPTTHAGTMGPPSRPTVDKPTDMNELSDVLLGSGVDLKAEEDALVNRHSAFNNQLSNGLYSSGYSENFDSPHAPNHHFNTYSSNIPGDRSTFYGAGTFNQPVAPYQSAEDRLEQARKNAKRRRAEIDQYHLNNPFLYQAPVMRRVQEQTRALHVIMPNKGLLSSRAQPSLGPQEVTVHGPDGHARVTVVNGQDILNTEAPMAGIMALISLATQERLRVLVEEAATLAKGRRVGSHGVVPLDLADLAVGNGAPESIEALPTPSQSAVSPKSNPLKRSSSSSSNKLPTPVSLNQSTPSSTLKFPNLIAQTLQKLSQADRTAEEARLAKRARRLANTDPHKPESSTATPAPATSTSTTTTTTGGGGGGGGLLGDTAPLPTERKNMTKKEIKALAKTSASEAQQRDASNKTATLALGSGGGNRFGGRTISWLSKGDQSGNTGFPGPSSSSRNNNAAKGGGLAAGGGPGGGYQGSKGAGGGTHLSARHRKFGDFREDGEGGRGIQLRDLVAVLEGNGREKKALARAYARLR